MLNMEARGDVAVLWQSVGPEVEAFDSMMERAAFLDVPRRDLISVAWRTASSGNARDPRQAAAREAYWKGWVLSAENPDSAMRLALRALELCDSLRYPYDHTRFSLGVADMLRITGNFADAYFIYHDKLKMVRGFGDRFWEAKTLVTMGRIMQDLGEPDGALRYYAEAQKIFESVGSNACVTKNRLNLANANYMLGNKEKGVEYLRGLEKNKAVLADSIYLANVLVSRFLISECTDEEAALKAWGVGTNLNNPSLTILTELSLVKLYMKRDELPKATDFAKSAFNHARKLKDYYSMRHALEGMEDCYRKRGMTDSASQCHLSLILLNDSLYQQEKVEELRRADHLAIINRYESDIREAEERHIWRQRVMLAVGCTIFLVLVLSLGLLWTSRRKTESDRRLEEEKNERLQLENRQQRLEIEAKEKELASNTLLLAQKNAKLKALGERVKEMEERGKIAPEEGLQLTGRIGDELSADDDWRFFKLRFEKVHPTFFSALTETYPELSRTEQRLCAYIRVGMSAKEIAQVLSVKPDTINTSRYRIRKKMNLRPEDNLETTLNYF